MIDTDLETLANLGSALSAFERGELVILCDHDSDQAIFMVCGDQVDAGMVNAMASLGRGIVGLALPSSKALHLGIRPQPCTKARDVDMPVALASIEAAACTGTGISADDRAMTIQAASNLDASALSVVTPGHIFPTGVKLPLRENPDLCETGLAIAIFWCGSDTIAWCHILDEQGEVASAQYCRNLGYPVVDAAEATLHLHD